MKQQLQNQRSFFSSWSILDCQCKGVLAPNIFLVLLPVYVKQSKSQGCYIHDLENYPVAHQLKDFLEVQFESPNPFRLSNLSQTHGMGQIPPAQPVQSWLTSLREEQQAAMDIWEMPFSSLFQGTSTLIWPTTEEFTPFKCRRFREQPKLTIQTFCVLSRASSIGFKAPEAEGLVN